VGERNIFFTRARPNKSDDKAHVGQNDGGAIRWQAFYYRYDTVVEQESINKQYLLARGRTNLSTAATKATEWRSNKPGKKARVYDTPSTPYQRVTGSGARSRESR
jgi:hypothetical protein